MCFHQCLSAFRCGMPPACNFNGMCINIPVQWSY
uniref:Uncharacterized protein n=1 Tax=Anguilla anguilla TaxID=7936 RepID=A0A0E9SB03_ANGAN